ncbi:multicopy suppressor of stt4 mutation [Talaromyces proteolyticus]|uniref:1-phosphatidylinositol-4-phosphate 5-kinase n=1 Tax=Talaromyces proteolyticus TaxID=1131652 RepID=A0AAD4KYM2_9EURO|nr:multicopy suppressor of stt4 mutation [Talaromyces proteolyticus]KAH8703946.1 multicopy suppressor of stt4 mutation [Talaromyces proteolyticus]
MPSILSDSPYQHQPSVSPSNSFDISHRKSYDKTPPVGNTFLYTAGPNGDAPNFYQQADHTQFLTSLKNGSVHSLNPGRSSIGSYTRERPFSKTDSTPSLASGSFRENTRDQQHHQLPSRGSWAMVDGYVNGSGSGPEAPHLNGTTGDSRSPSLRPVQNGDYYRLSTSEDRGSFLDSSQSTYHTANIPLSTSLPNDYSLFPPEPDRLAPPGKRSQHRYSSPPPPTDFEPTSPSSPSRQSQRSTLQVPRSAARRSRDLSLEETRAYSTGTAGSHFRRSSLSLVRRATRTSTVEHPDEALTDEDAARWAEAIKQKRARKKRREEEDEDRVIVGTKVDQNHVNWVTAYNMLTGIRFVVSRINAKMDRELTPADFEAKHKFSFDITGKELTPSAKYDFKFKDYAPWVFRRLRAKFKLDPADYLMSLTSKYILSELGSPGKSGSFFYFSRDYKYIIKTIHHSEHKLLRKILPDYYKHVENNPNTLISQFYGLHRVKMAYGRKIHFVVMNNLFPPHRDIHQTFDLKGSTVGRDLREEDLERNPRATMKDLNWLRRNRHLEEGPMKREIFMAQLRRDVSLLQRLKIMDYSLLVGIHDLGRGNEEKLRDKTLQVFQPGGDRDDDPGTNLLIRTPSKLESARKARELRLTLKRERPVPIQQTAAKMPDEILDERKNLVFYSDDGGFRATHENGQAGEEIYYLGIIDCLTPYGIVKKAEHFWKGLSHNRNQISPIPPQQYGERFIQFMEGITMSKEEAERLQQSRANEITSEDTTRVSEGMQRDSSVEQTMQAAENEARQSGPEPHTRTLATMWDPHDINSIGGPSTLPIVDEAGEAASQKSGRSRRARYPLDPTAQVSEKTGDNSPSRKSHLS